MPRHRSNSRGDAISTLFVKSTAEGGPATDLPVVVHLPRHFNLLNDENRNQIATMASAFAGRIYGMVIHDHPELVSRSDEYVRAAQACSRVWHRLSLPESCLLNMPPAWSRECSRDSLINPRIDSHQLLH